MPAVTHDIATLYRQLNTDEAAAFLCVSKRKLELMRQQGNGPNFIKVSPKCVRYRFKDLIEFQDARVRANTISNTPPAAA